MAGFGFGILKVPVSVSNSGGGGVDNTALLEAILEAIQDGSSNEVQVLNEINVNVENTNTLLNEIAVDIENQNTLLNDIGVDTSNLVSLLTQNNIDNQDIISLLTNMDNDLSNLVSLLNENSLDNETIINLLSEVKPIEVICGTYDESIDVFVWFYDDGTVEVIRKLDSVPLQPVDLAKIDCGCKSDEEETLVDVQNYCYDDSDDEENKNPWLKPDGTDWITPDGQYWDLG